MALALGNPVEHLRNQVLRNSILEHKPDLAEYLFLSEMKQIIKKSKKKVLELRFFLISRTISWLPLLDSNQRHTD